MNTSLEIDDPPPLQMVCRWYPITKASTLVAKILLDYGADPSAPEDHPPIASALHNGSIAMMDVLHAVGVRIPQRDVHSYWEARDGPDFEAVCAYLLEQGYHFPREEAGQEQVDRNDD